jgi:hypothetical protein
VDLYFAAALNVRNCTGYHLVRLRVSVCAGGHMGESCPSRHMQNPDKPPHFVKNIGSFF